MTGFLLNPVPISSHRIALNKRCQQVLEGLTTKNMNEVIGRIVVAVLVVCALHSRNRIRESTALAHLNRLMTCVP